MGGFGLLENSHLTLMSHYLIGWTEQTKNEPEEELLILRRRWRIRRPSERKWRSFF